MEIKSIDCPKCGGIITEKIGQGKLFRCTHCGSLLVWPEKKETLVLSFGTNLCPDCGVDNEKTRKFCRNCGAPLTRTCPACNATFYVGDSYCPNGHEQDRLEKLGLYFNFIDTNLKRNGYENIQFAEYDKAYYKSDFNLLSLKNEYFCIFKYIDTSLTPAQVKEFSSDVFQNAKKMKKGNVIYCYPVLITDNSTSDVRDFIRSYNPKHNSIFEFPVIQDLSSSDLYYFTGTPLVGAAMYPGIRKRVELLFRVQ